MRHTLSGNFKTLEVRLDEEILDPEPSKAYHKHSEGFNWGYAGSGPAQLALAVMLKLKGTHEGYQRFKFEVITGLPHGVDFKIQFELETNQARIDAINNAKAYNKYISRELLSIKTNRELLCYVHPNERKALSLALGVTD